MRRIVVLLVLLFIGWCIWAFSFALPRRTTVVVAGDPTLITSWDEPTGKLVLIRIPSETIVEATGGYGAYELRSLWDLGEIEGASGSVLAQSTQEALGVPVPYFMGPTTPLDAGGTITFATAFDVLRGRVKTNMPTSFLLALAWRSLFLRPDAVDAITLSQGRGVARVAAPDGSTSLVFDQNQADALLGSSFEDEEIRREALSVAIYNTTTMGALGTRVGRMLSHLGYLVVAVENDEPIVERCEVRITGAYVKSVSVEKIRDVLDCTITPDDTSKRADIVLRVGLGYARRFLPDYSP